MVFHSQTNGQTKQMNQELEQYLQIFVDYIQEDWPEQLVLVEFAVNNKIHSATNISLFIVNYKRELRMGVDIRRNGKMEKLMEFAERMKRVQEEVVTELKKAQKEMKQQADKRRKEAEVWKVGDKVMVSTKDLVFKEWLVKKLVDYYVGLYIIDEVVSTNTVKLQLPTSIRIHLVVNVSWVVQYKEQVGGQKVKEVKPVEVEGVKEQEVEKILNKRKVREVVKYLV